MMDDVIHSSELARARAFAAERKWLHAVQVYRRLVDADPSDDEAWVELAHAYASMGRIDAAEEVLKSRSERSETRELYLFLLGSLMFQEGRYRDAHRYLVPVLRAEQSLDQAARVRLHFLLGAIFAEEHRWSVSEYHFRTVLRLDGNYPRIHESLAEVLLRRGRHVDAEFHLRKATDDEPFSWFGHFLLGSVYVRRRQWEDALEQFTMCVDIDPKEPRGWMKCGEAMVNLKRLEEAEHYLRKSLELNPALTDAIVEVGYLALARGDMLSAEECFERALSAEPGHKKAMAGSRSIRRTSGGGKRR